MTFLGRALRQTSPYLSLLGGPRLLLLSHRSAQPTYAALPKTHELAHLRDKINDPLATKLVDAVIILDRISAQAERPELDDDTGQQLSDCNPPLPCLLAVFAEGDPVSASFDEEAQGMMEVEPEPNIIIPFDPTDTASVRRTFQTFGVACQTIAAASRVIDLMPGNDQWIISR